MRNQDIVAALVEAAQGLLDQRLDPAQAVVGEVGLEAGVQAGDDGQLHRAGQALRLES